MERSGPYTPAMSLPDMPLGSTGVMVRPLGVGTNSWGDHAGEGVGATNPAAAVEAALAAGVSLFDTAEIYNRGASERALGRALAGTDAPAFVATKFAPLPWRVRSGSLRRALDASLRRLQRETVDLYQIHFPFTLLRIPSLMNRLADAVEAGHVPPRWGQQLQRRADAGSARCPRPARPAPRLEPGQLQPP